MSAERGDFIDSIEGSSFVRLSKALAPISIVIAAISLVLGQFDRLTSISDRQIRLQDRAYDVILERKSGDRRFSWALSLLNSEKVSFIGFDFSSESPSARIEAPNAVLSNSIMDGANFSLSNFTSSNFENAHLSGAIFDEASVSWVDFRKAQLRGASFVGTDLLCVNFGGAHLDAVNFSGAAFSDAMGCDGLHFEVGQLSSAFYYADAPPSGLPLPRLGEMLVCPPSARGAFINRRPFSQSSLLPDGCRKL